MNAEILSVGTEILLGNIVNTNAQFLSNELSKLGIFVFFQTSVGDNKQRLLEAYKIAFSRSDIVITTGGLGPTEDDITKEIGSQYFNKELILHEESLNNIKNLFSNQNLKFTENNIKQAYVPKNSIVLKNNNGTAPGIIINENNKTLIMLPGPPNEMQLMYKESVEPYLAKLSNVTLFSKTLRICGVGESLVETNIKDLIDNQTNPTIAPYAKTSEVHLRITAKAKNNSEAKEIIKPTIDELYSRLGDNIYGEDETSLEQTIVNILKEKNLTISCAESCTGGMISSTLVNCPGVSSVFLEGAVTYSNNAKMLRLNVNSSTLEKYGAVSEEVALEMASGIAKTSNSNIGISTTGIAGPDGGTNKKPVGLVYVGIFINGNCKAYKLNFEGNREKIRNRTTVVTLDLLRRELIKL